MMSCIISTIMNLIKVDLYHTNRNAVTLWRTNSYFIGEILTTLILLSCFLYLDLENGIYMYVSSCLDHYKTGWG